MKWLSKTQTLECSADKNPFNSENFAFLWNPLNPSQKSVLLHFESFISNGLSWSRTKRQNKTKQKRDINWKADTQFGSWSEEITQKLGRLLLLSRIANYSNALILSSHMVAMMTHLCFELRNTVWILHHKAHWQSRQVKIHTYKSLFNKEQMWLIAIKCVYKSF